MAIMSHPLDSLKPEEIRTAVAILKKKYGAINLRFKTASIREPPKSELVPYLDAERAGKTTPPRPARIVSISYHTQDIQAFTEAHIDVGQKKIVSIERLDGVQGPIDFDEYKAVEKLCLEHAAVLKEVKKMKLPEGTTIRCEPWIYGTDDANENRRLAQCYM